MWVHRASREFACWWSCRRHSGRYTQILHQHRPQTRRRSPRVSHQTHDAADEVQSVAKPCESFKIISTRSGKPHAKPLRRKEGTIKLTTKNKSCEEEVTEKTENCIMPPFTLFPPIKN